MIEQIDAAGRPYREVVSGLGPSFEGGKLGVVYFLDGDDTKGELHLGNLKEALDCLSVIPDAERNCRVIKNSVDCDREAWVLLVPSEYERLLPLPEVVNVPSSLPLPEANDNLVEPPDRFEGKRYIVTASRKGFSNYQIIFLSIYTNPEKIEEEAMATALRMFSNNSGLSSPVDVSWQALDKETFFKEVLRKINEGKYLNGLIIDSDPRIRQYLREKANKKRPSRR